ncbi:MAG: hypothetical protein Q7J38_11575 [Gallionella sp.]|nr:hypothetical protein [Gallionella sp.]
MKKLFVSLFLLCFASFTANASTMEDNWVDAKLSKARLERVKDAFSTSSDQSLVASFLKIEETEVQQPKSFSDTQVLVAGVFNDSIVFVKLNLVKPQIGKPVPAVWEEADNLIDDSDSDAIATHYIKSAIARGNVVRVYKPDVAQGLNRRFSPATFWKSYIERNTGKAKALIEYTKNGEAVSLMGRYRQSNRSDSSLDEYVPIYFGAELVEHFNNTFPVEYLKKQFIREITSLK